MRWDEFKCFVRAYPHMVHEAVRQLAGNPRRLTVRYDSTEIWDGLTVFNLSCWEEYYEHWYPCRIVVNRDTMTIDWNYTTPEPFDREYKGSGIIGVHLFSLPVTLPLLPFIKAVNYYNEKREENCGLSLAFDAVLRQITSGDNCPNSLDEDLLRRAAHNDWKEQRRRRSKLYRRISFSEAQDLLSDCKQYVARRQGSGSDAIHYSWRDEEGDFIGEITFIDGQSDGARILGSRFNREDSAELVDCFRIRKDI